MGEAEGGYPTLTSGGWMSSQHHSRISCVVAVRLTYKASGVPGLTATTLLFRSPGTVRCILLSQGTPYPSYPFNNFQSPGVGNISSGCRFSWPHGDSLLKRRVPPSPVAAGLRLAPHVCPPAPRCTFRLPLPLSWRRPRRW